jgi:hypothetical protein
VIEASARNPITAASVVRSVAGRSAFDEARRIYGTFDAFLRDGLHLDVDQLRRNLLS